MFLILASEEFGSTMKEIVKTTDNQITTKNETPTLN